MRPLLFILTFALADASAIPCRSTPICKVTPYNESWPSDNDWKLLNTTINGSLLRTVPAASACWNDSSFNSPISCDIATSKWTNGTWHLLQPKSIDYQTYANNTCLPKHAPGYSLRDAAVLILSLSILSM
jgi:hypothetical protein